MPALAATAPTLTLGAALSNRTRDRPCVSLPVTTRRIGFMVSAIAPSRIPGLYLIGLHITGFDDSGRARYIRAHESIEILNGRSDRLESRSHRPLLDIGYVHNFDDLAIDLLDDRARRLRRHMQTIPADHGKFRIALLGYRRNLRQLPIPFGAAHRERAQPAGFYQRQPGRSRHEHHLHLTRHHVG